MLVRNCVLSSQPSYIQLLSYVATQLVHILWYYATLHSHIRSYFATVYGYKVAPLSTVLELELHNSLATCPETKAKAPFDIQKFKSPCSYE